MSFWWAHQSSSGGTDWLVPLTPGALPLLTTGAPHDSPPVRGESWGDDAALHPVRTAKPRLFLFVFIRVHSWLIMSSLRCLILGMGLFGKMPFSAAKTVHNGRKARASCFPSTNLPSRMDGFVPEGCNDLTSPAALV